MLRGCVARLVLSPLPGHPAKSWRLEGQQQTDCGRTSRLHQYTDVSKVCQLPSHQYHHFGRLGKLFSLFLGSWGNFLEKQVLFYGAPEPIPTLSRTRWSIFGAVFYVFVMGFGWYIIYSLIVVQEKNRSVSK